MRIVSKVCATLSLAAGLLAQEYKLGSPVDQLSLTDLAGQPVQLSTQGNLSVVLFVSTQCPVSNAYNERMNVLYQEYGKKGVQFVFVNANANESAENTQAHTQANGLTYKTHKDPNNELADKFNAQVTPEAFVIGKDGRLVYHGSIDDAREPSRAQVHGLRMALDALLAGQPVAKSETKSFGCTIKRAPKAS